MGESANRDHERMKIDPEQRDILSNVGERAEDQKLVLEQLDDAGRPLVDEAQLALPQLHEIVVGVLEDEELGHREADGGNVLDVEAMSLRVLSFTLGEETTLMTFVRNSLLGSESEARWMSLLNSIAFPLRRRKISEMTIR